MGLLDTGSEGGFFGTSWEDPRTMGILAFAQGLRKKDISGGLLGYAHAIQQGKQQALLNEFNQMRMQEARLGLEDRKRKAEFLSNLPDPSFAAGQQALAGGGGPTLANAANVPAVSPQHQMLFQATKAGVVDVPDYLKAITPREEEYSQTPQIVRDPQTGDLVNVLISKTGKTKIMPFGVKPDVQLQDTGAEIRAIDKNAIGHGFAVNKTGNPFNDLILSDGQGGFRVNQPLHAAKASIARSGAPSIHVNTDKSYFGNIAEGLAKNDVTAIEAARSAPERVQTARRVKEILTGSPITGTGADARLAINKALATAGLVDGKNVADTEVLASTLAAQALDAIKSSGLGGGNGFSNADRDFLERARAGKIDMTSQTLGRIADLNEKAAVQAIKRGNAVIGKLRMSPQAGQMGQMLDPIPEPLPAPIVRRPPVPAGQPGKPGKAIFLGFE